MPKCWACGEENLTGEEFCESCGAKLEPQSAETPQEVAPANPEEAVLDPPPKAPRRRSRRSPAHAREPKSEAESPEAAPEAESPVAAPEVVPATPEDEGPEPPKAPRRRSRRSPAHAREPKSEAESPEAAPEAESPEAAPDAESPEAAPEVVPATPESTGPAWPPKAGYLIFPDKTEKQIPPSQWLIGRADLAEYLSDTQRAQEISRGHITVFQEGDKFYIEDGKTMVQEKPSANKTWLVRDGSRSLITGSGRNELQDADEIDIAELVKLQFAAK